MIGTARLVKFLVNYGPYLALAGFVTLAAWWLYDQGVEAERARWEKAQQEKTDALRKELSKANEASRAAETRLLEVAEQRDKILMDYQAAIASEPVRECLGADGLRDFNATIQRLRPVTPGTVR